MRQLQRGMTSSAWFAAHNFVAGIRYWCKVDGANMICRQSRDRLGGKRVQTVEMSI
jgi:hypothetical protein